MGEVNGAGAVRAAESARLNPLKEESAPDEALNETLWRSVKGKNSVPPTRVYQKDFDRRK